MVKHEHSAVVEAANLTKVFKDFWMRTKAVAVDSISFEIHRNEIFGLLGPNGSGKSTTIKMILGLLNKTGGRLSVLGRHPSDVVVKKYIGFLPEESYLYRYLSARETLDYYGKLFGIDRRTRRRRTDELLDMVGLSNVSHRAVGEFSKGMTRRIGIAQALVNDPEFLILDEPTSGLDPIGTRQVKDVLIELRRRGKTILLSSHLLADVEDVCDRLVVLYGGKIRAEGTADELLSDTNQTVIRTPRLAPAVITEIEEVLQKHGQGVDEVSARRQRLEDLFLEIVEQARQEQVATSGAIHGGETAAFLRGEEAEGDSLIDSLVAEADAAPVREVSREVERVAPEQQAAEEREGVLADLMDDEPEPPPVARPAAPMPEKPSDVDDAMIQSLLDTPKDDEKSD